MHNTIYNFIKENKGCFRDKIIEVNKTFFIEEDLRKHRFESSKQLREKQFGIICKAFDISDDDKTLASPRFENAASSRELREINQLNSSALLAFLCFHKVSKDCPVWINKEKYTDVLFEIKSYLQSYRRSTPRSNVDVVLLNETNALFLESKFAEYLTPRPYKVKPYYRDSPQAYNNLFGKTINWDAHTSSHEKFSINFDQDSCLWKSSMPVYLEGIKQMICHYLGISYQVELRKNNKKIQQICKDWRCHKLNDTKIKLKLGEIVFKFPTATGKDGTPDFDLYSAAYKELYEQIHSKTKELTILDDLLTYQEVFSDSRNSGLLMDVTRKFYGLNR